MSSNKSQVQSFRKPMLMVGSGFRGFFAPYVQGASPAPIPYDPARQGRFDTNAPPTGWFDLGWIDQLKRSPAGRIGQIRPGYHGAACAQYHSEIGGSVEFEFRECGKKQRAFLAAASLICQWSVIFVVDTFDGAQLYYYYPQLSVVNDCEEGTFDINNASIVDLKGTALRAEFDAVVHGDPVDGETVVCYRGFVPALESKF